MSEIKVKPKDKPHYVNNREFSLSIVDYVKSVNDAKEKCTEVPIVPTYIATCFLKISEGLAHKSNFVRYTYREEMVMDAVENCLRAINNYNIETKTRTGMPNAFAYFTQICYYAFLRRIEKEKKQQDVKLRWIEKAGFEDFMDDDEGGNHEFFDELRNRIDRVKQSDNEFKEFSKKEKQKAKIKANSGVELFMG